MLCGVYGFQKLPPITSAISTLYDWKRGSTVAIRGSWAASIRGVAAAGGVAAATAEGTQATMAAMPTRMSCAWGCLDRRRCGARHVAGDGVWASRQ
ncbi:hypothetical protein RLIN73S_06243 [Rhodanobacter lindaniclasticus]